MPRTNPRAAARMRRCSSSFWCARNTRRLVSPAPHERCDAPGLILFRCLSRRFCRQAFRRPLGPGPDVVAGSQPRVSRGEVQEAGPQADLAVRDRHGTARCAGFCEKRSDFVGALEDLELPIRIDLLPGKQPCARNVPRGILALAPSIDDSNRAPFTALYGFCGRLDIGANARQEATAGWAPVRHGSRGGPPSSAGALPMVQRQDLARLRVTR